MAKYLLMIFLDEKAAPPVTDGPVDPAYLEFMDRHASALLNGGALESSETATSVRRDGGGGFLVTDGPFAESKEAMAGYYLIEAADLDEALRIAKDVPAPHGGVEVRPLWAAS